MSEIAEFLRGQYRQQAHVARLIAEKTGSAEWKSDWRRLSYNDFDARVLAAGEPVFDGYGSVGTAEFVVTQSPAHVLADLEAKLSLVDLFEFQLDWNADHDQDVTPHEVATLQQAAREGLRLLAQPFARHPDHKGEEWAP